MPRLTFTQIMATRLVPMVGFGWTMRICAFLILGLLIIGSLTITCRLKPMKKHFSLYEFVAPLQETPFALINACAFVGFIGLFIPITYIVVQAGSVGMSTNLQGYLVPVLNGTSLFGRTTQVASYAGDSKACSLNVLQWREQLATFSSDARLKQLYQSLFTCNYNALNKATTV